MTKLTDFNDKLVSVTLRSDNLEISSHGIFIIIGDIYTIKNDSGFNNFIINKSEVRTLECVDNVLKIQTKNCDIEIEK
jgi:hypothetical protein